MGSLWGGLLDLIGASLSFFYDLAPMYGIAIVLLTIVISLLMFPLTLKQTRSMKGMQEIQPEVKRLQKELKGDREKLNQELMALYNEHGVNPAAGCLPLLVQMPIWFALFRVLQKPLSFVPESSELARAIDAGRTKFLGMDLRLRPSEVMSNGVVTAIPYVIAILVVVATGYYQQRQTMVRARNNGEQNPQQQSMQTVMKVFPLIFGFISWSLPAGLVVYFAVSQMFRIGQQALILKLDEGRPATPGAARAADEVAEPVSDGGTTRSRPQQGSKKRKRKRRRK